MAVGYFVAGIPGAIAGWAAMTTPALLINPLVHFVGRKLDDPRVKTILQTIVIASAGLLLAAVIPLARDALTDWLTVVIAVLTVVLLLVSEIDTLWIVLGSAAASLTASVAGLDTYLERVDFRNWHVPNFDRYPRPNPRCASKRTSPRLRRRCAANGAEQIAIPSETAYPSR